MYKIDGPMDDISLNNIFGGENEYELLNARSMVSNLAAACPNRRAVPNRLGTHSQELLEDSFASSSLSD